MRATLFYSTLLRLIGWSRRSRETRKRIRNVYMVQFSVNIVSDGPTEIPPPGRPKHVEPPSHPVDLLLRRDLRPKNLPKLRHSELPRVETAVQTTIPNEHVAKVLKQPNHLAILRVRLPDTVIAGRLAQLARAPRLHRGGRGFESLIAHPVNPAEVELSTTRWVFCVIGPILDDS